MRFIRAKVASLCTPSSASATGVAGPFRKRVTRCSCAARRGVSPPAGGGRWIRPPPRAWGGATDACGAALAVARDNAATLGIGNVEFVGGSWFAPLAGRRFDLVASNPPYVAEGDPHLGEGDLRFEPARALSSGRDGLDDTRRIIAEAPAHLEPGGWLLLEHGHDQGDAVRALLLEAGFVEVATCRDLEHRDRVSLGRRLE